MSRTPAFFSASLMLVCAFPMQAQLSPAGAYYPGGSSGHLLGLGIETPSSPLARGLSLSRPITSLGRRLTLTIGRMPERASSFALLRSGDDTYFPNPYADESAFRMDGVRLTTAFGSIQFEALGATLSSIRGPDGMAAMSSPLAGGSGGYSLFTGNQRTAGQPSPSQFSVNQLTGVSLGLGLNQLYGGHVRVTALDVANHESGNPADSLYGAHVVGADTDLKITGQLAVSADFGRTIPHLQRDGGLYGGENNAADASLGFASGAISLAAGYRYIDPLFYAPGYWGRIGNWINPTNIQGPSFRASYDVTRGLGLSVGGDYYTAARDRAVVFSDGVPLAGVGGLGKDDEISRVLVGLRWDIARNLRTTVDWEGVYWKLQGVHSGIPAMGAGTVRPMESYLNIGAGYSLTSNALLKIMYQIGSFDGQGALSYGSAGTRANFGAITSQISVKF